MSILRSRAASLALLFCAAALVALGGSIRAEKGADELRIFSGEPRLIIVHGYSTSRRWPDLLQEKLDRHFDGKRVIEVKKVLRGGTPIAKWIDVAEGKALPPWKDVREAIESGDGRPVIVLAQQSLQWAFGKRGEGIRNARDADRIRRGADVLKTYARLLLEDGADHVFIATHIYKKPMEPEIGNERLALDEFLRRKMPGVHRGPDVWKATKKRHPDAFARDGVHPSELGSKIMAERWFEALLEHDG